MRTEDAESDEFAEGIQHLSRLVAQSWELSQMEWDVRVLVDAALQMPELLRDQHPSDLRKMIAKALEFALRLHPHDALSEPFRDRLAVELLSYCESLRLPPPLPLVELIRGRLKYADTAPRKRPRSPDKKFAAAVMLAMQPDLGDRELARRLGYKNGHQAIGKWRDEEKFQRAVTRFARLLADHQFRGVAR
jgi:hypothetical protein